MEFDESKGFGGLSTENGLMDLDQHWPLHATETT